MGYPDVQDGGPPRSQAGAEPPDGPLPAEPASTGAPEYAPPPVPGPDGATWRDNGTAARPGYDGPGHDSPGYAGSGYAAPGYPAPGNGVPGHDRPSGGGSRHAGPRHSSGPGYEPESDVPRPAARAGAHRAVSGTDTGSRAPQAPATGTEGTSWPPGQGSGASLPRGTATGPQDQPWHPAPPPAGLESGSRPAGSPGAAPRDQSWHSATPAGPDTGLRPAGPGTGPQHSAVPAPTAGDRSRAASPGTPARASSPWPSAPGAGSTAADTAGRPADGRAPGAGTAGLPQRRPAADDPSWPSGPASTGPQPSHRARPDGLDDAPPGLAITREPPGARRRAGPQDAAPGSGGRRGPIRGYPPAPGQPDPVYPPGQFSPWNRASTRAAWLGTGPAATGPAEPDAEPGYSALALSDAAADLTATQTWAVIDDEPPPSLPPSRRARRDWDSHAEELGPIRPRTAEGGAAPGRATDSRAPAPRRARPPAPGAGERTAAGERRADPGGPTASRLRAEAGPGLGAARLGDAGLGAGRYSTGPGAAGLGDAGLGAGRDATGPGAARLGDAGPGTAGLGDPGLDAAGRAAADVSTTGPRNPMLGATDPGTRRPGAAELDTAGPVATVTGPGATAVRPAGAGRATAPGASVLGGPEGLGAPAAGDRTRPGSRMAARRAGDTARQAPSAFDESRRGQPPRIAGTRHQAGDGTEAAPRRSGRRGRRHNAMMAALLLAPVLVVVLVAGGYVYLSSRHAPAAPHAGGASHPTAARISPTAAPLGPWKHIESRSQDPVPLTVSELFPAKFATDGVAGTLTATKAGSKCTREVIGSKLATAVHKAGCTQVLRASYLSTDRKIMATVGVLNLENAAAAVKAGKAAGAVEFIKQLAATHGPTRNIAKGTGIVAAFLKGHYLILTWTEFADLRSPSGKSKRTELEHFSTGLVAGTANVSLTNRMVTGHPSGTSASS